ncbi:pirin family protein [Microlunatus spumicola]|uniref:Pirin family protein n=1 Tax=Microlunatus spumicola TaxID=81499 RepID=A0ABP6WVV7_9ACTN
MQGVEVRRSGDRFLTVAPARPDAAEGWAVTHHSFSFGEHYDPDNVGFRSLVALNDETVRAGEGYPEHLHRDVEIVTWVLSGALEHADDAYADEDVVTLVPGFVQLLSAGAGVRHAEGASADAPVHFVQTWVRPDEPGGPPRWSSGGVADESLASGWALAASGSDAEALVYLRSRGTSLWVTRLAPGVGRPLPEAPAAYALVARGAVEVEGVGRLDEGDALKITTPAPLAVTAVEPAELLVWTFA